MAVSIRAAPASPAYKPLDELVSDKCIDPDASSDPVPFSEGQVCTVAEVIMQPSQMMSKHRMCQGEDDILRP